MYLKYLLYIGKKTQFLKDRRQALEKLYEQPEYMAQISAAALKFVRIKRNQANHLGRRVVFLEKQLKHEAFVQKMPPLPDCTGLMTYMRRATREFGLGQYREAVDILEKVVQLHPGFQQAHALRAKAFLELEQYQELLGQQTQTSHT